MAGRCLVNTIRAQENYPVMSVPRPPHDHNVAELSGVKSPFEIVEPVRGLLRAHEELLEARSDVQMRVVRNDGAESRPDLGTLYLTDRRLIHLDGKAASIELTDIRELSLARHRLLLSLQDATGVILDLRGAGSLRARVATALSALRTR
jgi:hypothetical protein